MGLKRPREETRCVLGADVTRHKNLKLQGEGGAGLSYGRIVHTNGAAVLGIWKLVELIQDLWIQESCIFRRDTQVILRTSRD